MYTAFLSYQLNKDTEFLRTFCLERTHLFLVGVELLPQSNTELLAQTLQAFEVLLVLVLSLNLGLDTCSSTIHERLYV
jgi:hypothetical protein